MSEHDFDLEGVGTGERKAFLRVLASLANADGDLAPAELETLHLAANGLSVALGERDLEPRDLEALADKVTRPALQERLLVELARLAEADERVDDEELATILYFARRWGCAPPPMAGVDWPRVEGCALELRPDVDAEPAPGKRSSSAPPSPKASQAEHEGA